VRVPDELIGEVEATLNEQMIAPRTLFFPNITLATLFLVHTTARQKDRSVNISAHFFLAQMMPLCQLRNTCSGSYTFNRQIYALDHPSLPLILLHNTTADFLERLFRFHVQLSSKRYARASSKLPRGVVNKRTVRFADADSKSPQRVGAYLPLTRIITLAAERLDEVAAVLKPRQKRSYSPEELERKRERLRVARERKKSLTGTRQGSPDAAQGAGLISDQGWLSANPPLGGSLCVETPIQPFSTDARSY